MMMVENRKFKNPQARPRRKALFSSSSTAIVDCPHCATQIDSDDGKEENRFVDDLMETPFNSRPIEIDDNGYCVNWDNAGREGEINILVTPCCNKIVAFQGEMDSDFTIDGVYIVACRSKADLNYLQSEKISEA